MTYNKDSYMAARNSQGVVSLSLSYFVSGVGAWVIFAVPQAACIGGWGALAGYALSTVFPLLLFGWIGPIMREALPNGYTLNEYVYGRFGLPCTVYFGTVSLFYMFLYLAAEFSSASTFATSLTTIQTQSSTWWSNENTFAPTAVSPILGVSVITMLYTALGGLPVSILTDRVQGVGILVVLVVIVIATYSEASGARSSEAGRQRWDAVTGAGVHPVYIPTDYGNSIAISLMMGVTCANMVHAGFWQRIWAAESNANLVLATYASSAMTLLVMVLTGVTGFVAYAHYGPNMLLPGVFDISFYSATWLTVDFLGEGWTVVMLACGIAMVASTADTLQAGMSALLLPLANWLFPQYTDRQRLGLIVGAMGLVNVPAILLALSGQSVLQLFLLADMLAATVVSPLFLGLHKQTHPVGALLGAVAGMLTVLVTYGAAEGYDEGFSVMVAQGGIFRRSATYAFCLAPAVSALVTVGVSRLAFPTYEFEGFAGKPGSALKGVSLEMSTDAGAGGTELAAA